MKKENNKLIAITGGSGFIGSHLVNFMKDKGFRARVLINKTDLKRDDIEKFYGSINNEQVIKKILEGVNIVFHLASALGNRIISNEEFLNINKNGTETLLKIAVEQGVEKVVHFSSAGVYGKSSGLIPLKEDNILNPIDIYEKSKLEGEKIALSYTDKLNISIIRPGWAYGEGDRRTFKLIKQINSGLFFIVGKGNKLQSPIYIDDLIEAVYEIASKGGNGEIYNAGGTSIPIKIMVNQIAKSLKKKILPLKMPLFLIYPPAFLLEKLFSFFNKEAPLTTSKLAFFIRGKPLNSDKLNNELNIKPETSFSEGIKKAIKWYKKMNWL
jgi:dihydroflavonol-4-reductase